MRLLNGFVQPLDAHVSVNLGRREAFMTEQLLHGLEVGSPIE